MEFLKRIVKGTFILAAVHLSHPCRAADSDLRSQVPIRVDVKLSVWIYAAEVQSPRCVEELPGWLQGKKPELKLVLQIARHCPITLIVYEIVVGQLLQKVHRHPRSSAGRHVSRSQIQIDRIRVYKKEASVQNPRFTEQMPNFEGVNVVDVMSEVVSDRSVFARPEYEVFARDRSFPRVRIKRRSSTAEQIKREPRMIDRESRAIHSQRRSPIYVLSADSQAQFGRPVLWGQPFHVHEKRERF